MGDNTQNKPAQDQNQGQDPTRAPQQEQGDDRQNLPGQQNRQGEAAEGGERIDTDGDGRTRDPSDTRPTDDGGRGEPVQR